MPTTLDTVDAGERQPRIDLAAAFRLAARFAWHEAVANHFSLALGADGRRFLINPRWRHFALLRASELLLLDADDPRTMQRADAPDPTAWCIHGALHRLLPRARCVLHLHPPHATALAVLAGGRILPIDQNTMRFFERVAYDEGFEGMALGADEGARIAAALGDRSVMLMANHGVLVVGDSVARAFDALYYLETACRTMLLALASGRELRVVPDAVARRVAAEWEDYPGFAEAHFAELKRLLDKEGADYAG